MSSSLSKIRDLIWPIKKAELRKFVPMALLLFIILLNQNLVRLMKDGVVVTSIGAEVISFIKLWIEMPVGILFVIIYMKMCNITSQEKAFRYIISFFLMFFLFFGFFLYPHQSIVHFSDQQIQKLITSFPNFRWFVKMGAQWSLVMFYVMGELWPVVVSTLLFWQLANKITSLEEAPRFYSFFKFFGLSNLLFAGIIGEYLTSDSNLLYNVFAYYFNSDKNVATVQILTTIVFISGIMSMFIQGYMENNFIITNNQKPEILKLNLVASLKLIISSRILWYITIITLAYSLCVNLIEGIWFSQAKALFPNFVEFTKYQSNVLFYTGISSMICAFLGSIVIRKLGWNIAALATPIMILLTGIIFFSSVIFKKDMNDFITNVIYSTASVLQFIVLLGTMQNILIKGVKYSLFDETREMIFINRNKELKTKGKAAADLLGAKIGKSSGAFIQFVTFFLFPYYNYESLAPSLLILLIITCIIWIGAVLRIASLTKLNKLKG